MHQEIRDEIYSVGILNPTLRVFDVFMCTEYGTTYNVYLVKGENKTALIEAAHHNRMDEFVTNLKEVVDPSEIDYIIFNHTEPDHSGSLPKLLEIAPNAKVVASMPALRFLKNIVNADFPSITATNDLTLDLGGKTLHFRLAPNLHWPDSMFTYIPESKIVFTCDFLGCHYCETRLEHSKLYSVEQYNDAFKFYYDNIMAPFHKNVLDGIQILDSLDFDFLAPSHGPALDSKAVIDNAKKLYTEWSTKPIKKTETAVIVYVSAYGYTQKIAEAIAEELTLSRFDVQLFDLATDSHSEALAAAMDADILFVGSSTINRNALPTIWNFLAGVNAFAMSGKLAGVFGSYGWSGEAVPQIKSYLTNLRCKVVGDGLKILFNPSTNDLSKAKEYAQELVEAFVASK